MIELSAIIRASMSQKSPNMSWFLKCSARWRLDVAEWHTSSYVRHPFEMPDTSPPVGKTVHLTLFKGILLRAQNHTYGIRKIRTSRRRHSKNASRKTLLRPTTMSCQSLHPPDTRHEPTGWKGYFSRHVKTRQIRQTRPSLAEYHGLQKLFWEDCVIYIATIITNDIIIS